MQIVEKGTLRYYRNRIVNIHPSLLPRHGGEGMYGRYVHEAVINSDDDESGATVHVVTEKIDKGRILTQRIVRRYKIDTPKTLAKRVLEAEHKLYPETLIEIQKGKIDLDYDCTRWWEGEVRDTKFWER